MRFNKFVLVERKDGSAEIRLACVENHCDMLDKGETCLGGGLFKVNKERKQVVMWDKSFDFGYPKFAERNVCLDDDYEGYDFYYVPDLFLPKDEEYRVSVEVIG